MEQTYVRENCKSFNARDIFECGQCFRWNVQEDGSYTGIFEKNVLNELVNGSSYTAIAQKLDSPVKSVDNAIQRIRKKTMKNLNLENKRKNNKS